MIRQANNIEFQELMGKPNTVVLDVRTVEEFTEGRLPNAVNLDLMCGAVDAACCDLDPKLTYLIYCRSGKRSMVAANILLSYGFSDVCNLTGGIMGWDGLIEH